MEKIIIIDTIFPQIHSGYRIPEFNYYLDNIPEAEIHTSVLNYPNAVCEATGLEKHLDKYFNQYPQNKNRIHSLNTKILEDLDIKCFYTLFLSNAFNFLYLFEKINKPFVFTLYPGGGMSFNNLGSYEMLKRVFSSPMFKGVVTTQMKTTNYILSNFPEIKNKVHHVYGGPVNTDLYLLPKEKNNNLDICFVSHKYMPKGEDKGYPTFIELATLIQKEFKHSHFHVVGGFNSQTIRLGDLESKFTFYGQQEAIFFKSFYPRMNAIISPIRSGFDTTDVFMGGSVVEASLTGVPIFLTDPHNQLPYLELVDNKDLVIIKGTADEMYSTIKEYLINSERLFNLGISGKEVNYRYFNLETQMKPRVELLLK